MATKRKFHVCFTVGAVVPWEKAILFGNLVAEAPIVLDYLTKTNGSLLPTGPREPERDWWDEGPLTERATSYRAILAARKHRLNAGQLDELALGKIPDLLTYRGFTAGELAQGAAGRGSRHEFYEIKPRSVSGILKGTEKVVWLTVAYAKKGLPYVSGSLYPRQFYPPSGVAELPMLMIDKRHQNDWIWARDVIKKRSRLNKADLVLEVRPAPGLDGLLLYRICVKLEDDDDEERKDSQVIQTARELVNSFVMSAVAGKPKEVAWEMGAVGRALEPVLLEGPRGRSEAFVPWRPPPVLFPMIDVDLVTGPTVLRPRLPALRDAVNTRRLALPGDRLMLCCDEVFWQVVIASQPSLLQYVLYLRQTPTRWASYSRDRGALGVRDAVYEAAEIYDAASAAVEARFKPLIDWVAKNPGEAVLIGVGVIVVSALAFWALPAMAAELAALEAASLAASSGAISGTFIETAAMSAAIMEQATALELATAAQLNLDAAILGAADAASVAAVQAEATAIATATTAPAGAALGAVAISAESALLRQASGVIAQRLVVEALKTGAPKLVTGGVGVTLMLASQTAFAASPGRARGGPLPAQEAFDKVIGSQAAGLYALRPETRPATPFPGGSPVKRTPSVGEIIDAAKFSPDAAKQLTARGEKGFTCRYVGELLVK